MNRPTPAITPEQRAALERAKRPGRGHLRQYGERPTARNGYKIVAPSARMGLRA